jgi:hypothetical protein
VVPPTQTRVVPAGEKNFEVPESAKGFDLMKQNKAKPQLNVP